MSLGWTDRLNGLAAFEEFCKRLLTPFEGVLLFALRESAYLSTTISKLRSGVILI